jgi:hypothetical protein
MGNLRGGAYEPKVLMDHRRSSPLIVFRFFCRHLSLALEVMNKMNSETHSCTVSLESLAILALSGSMFFIFYARNIGNGQVPILSQTM